MSHELVVDDRGPIATFAFNRPAARNALTEGILSALVAGLARCASRNDLRAVVLRGMGDGPFSSGFNLDELPNHPLSGDEARALHAPIRAVADAILACPHPVIGAARKFVFGAALDVYAHCDLRICTNGTVFCMPPNRFGFLYPIEGLQRLVDIVGLTRATAMLLQAPSVTSDRAVTWGLVHESHAEDAFEDALSALCATVAANAPLSMRGTKAALLARRGVADDALVGRMYTEIASCMNSDDVREGKTAFREKRLPRFEGK